MKPELQILIGSIIIAFGAVAGAVGGVFFKTGLENINKQSVVKKQLDVVSLSALTSTYGLIFPGVNIDIETIRHLMSLGLISLEIFPSQPVTFGYYLNNEGRAFLAKEYNAKLYPKIFSDLIIVRYWEAYPDEFVSEKNKFNNRYKIPWEFAWKEFEQIIKTKESQSTKDAISIFLNYINTHSYDIVAQEIVNPWLSRINIRKS